MKLRETTSYTLRTFSSNSREPLHSITSNNIEFESPKMSNGIHSFAISSPIILTIDGNTRISSGNTIIIEEKGLHKINLFNPFDLSTVLYQETYKYLKEYDKNFAVIISSPTGNPICMYLGNTINYYFPTDLSKTTKLTIDGKELYIHRATFEVISKALFKD